MLASRFEKEYFTQTVVKDDPQNQTASGIH